MSLQDVDELFHHGTGFDLSHAKWQNFAMFIVAFVTAILISLYSYKKYNELMSDEVTPLLQGTKDP